MRIQYASDLHLEFSSRPLTLEDMSGDILVLAGDIAVRPADVAQYMHALSERKRPVIFVLGNHEMLGHYWETGVQEYKDAVAKLQNPFLHVLENEEIIVNGVRFLGATLWADFADGKHGKKAMACMPEFSSILRLDPTAKLTWQTVQERHKASVSWLSCALASDNRTMPTVVVTHHAPSWLSSHPKFAMSGLSGAFCSDLDRLIERHGPDVWIHGHTHDSFSYQIGKTAVVCNPFGYLEEEENKNWNPHAVVDVPCRGLDRRLPKEGAVYGTGAVR